MFSAIMPNIFISGHDNLALTVGTIQTDILTTNCICTLIKVILSNHQRFVYVDKISDVLIAKSFVDKLQQKAFQDRFVII